MSFTPVPQSTIANLFLAAPSAITDHLRPMIMGGHAGLARFAQPTEKAHALIGAYDPTMLHTYPYPSLIGGNVVDQSFIQVHIDDALLRYYKKVDGVSPAITLPASYLNRIRSVSTRYKSNGVSYPRDVLFLDRDVTIGDVVDVRGTVSAVDYSLRTTIAGFIAEVIAASVASATAGGGNATTQVLSNSQSQTAGTSNHVEIGSVDDSTYNGLYDGDINETYTVVVTVASTGGDATTATLSVTSASGNDNVASLHPAAFSAPTAIGSRGLTATWDTSGGGGGSPAGDYIVGQTWVIHVHQAFTAPAATSSGTYIGGLDNTYLITVIQGGTYVSGNALIKVTSTLGIDASGPTVISAAATPFPVGSLGVMVAFNHTALNAGDTYSIAVTAASQGGIQTLVLANNLPSALSAATDLEVDLYIKQKPATIPQIRASAGGVFNWTPHAATIDINSGILAYDPTWTDSGVQEPLPVIEGQLYVDVRQWLTTFVGQINGVIPADTLINQTATITTLLGVIDPANPLAFGVYCAVLNASGSLVGFTAVADPTNGAKWDDALDAISFVGDVYNIVPLTQDVTILPKFTTHVDAQSASTVGSYRVAWESQPLVSPFLVVDATKTSDTTPILADVDANPAEVGTEYTLVTAISANSLFVTNGVQPGDTVRYQYTTDSWGQVTWSEYTVASVVNEDQLVLVDPGTGMAVDSAQRLEVWRTLSKTQLAEGLQAKIVAINDRRIRNVWPDVIGGQPGYFLAAATAGLSSGAPSQQGLRNVEVLMPAGFQDLSRYNALLAGDINTLIEHGCWVVATTQTGDLYNKSAVTTSQSGNKQDTEEMVVRNVDAVAIAVIDALTPFIGSSNVTPDTVDNIQTTVSDTLTGLIITNIATNLGSIIIEVTQEPVATINPVLADQVIVVYGAQFPYPLNSINVTQVIVL